MFDFYQNPVRAEQLEPATRSPRRHPVAVPVPSQSTRGNSANVQSAKSRKRRADPSTNATPPLRASRLIGVGARSRTSTWEPPVNRDSASRSPSPTTPPPSTHGLNASTHQPSNIFARLEALEQSRARNVHETNIDINSAEGNKNTFPLLSGNSSSLPPLTERIIDKIKSGSFINFDSLLPLSVVSDDVVFVSVRSDNFSEGSHTLHFEPRKSTNKKVTDFNSWLCAWNAFVRVAVCISRIVSANSCIINPRSVS